MWFDKKEQKHSSAKSQNLTEACVVGAPTCSHDSNVCKVIDFYMFTRFKRNTFKLSKFIDVKALFPATLKKLHFIRVSMYSAHPVSTGDRFTIYVVIQAMQRSSCLQGKGSSCTFISQLFWDPEYWFGPGNWSHNLLLCSQVLYSPN